MSLVLGDTSPPHEHVDSVTLDPYLHLIDWSVVLSPPLRGFCCFI